MKESTLASQFGPEELTELLDPQEHTSTPSDNPALKLSLMNFISFMGSSQAVYEAARQNVHECYPDVDILLYWQAKQQARNLSGIITWEHHMCVKTCLAFTGLFANLEHCPDCGKARYKEEDLLDSDGEQKVPRKVFTTFPVGPQIQACWKHPQTAKDMSYRWEKTQEVRQERAETDEFPGLYNDIFCGEAYQDTVDSGLVGEYDTVLMFSTDGAQLYQNKQSDCWIYIWIIANLGPDKHYKIRNILPRGVIPRPKPPGNLDSFLFPGLAHIAALQREGLPIWDAYRRQHTLTFIFLLLVLADAIAMAQLSRSVGHHGRKGCRLLCGFIGRNKAQGAHYYPALLRPISFGNHRSSSHPDADINSLPIADPKEYKTDLFYIISAGTENEFKRRRYDTGIGKPSIFAGISHILPIPTCFAGDLMHQPLINLATLLLDLWCARPGAHDYDCFSVWPWAVLTGDVWTLGAEGVLPRG